MNISRISLLGLAIVWRDTAAEEVIRKHCHLSNNEVSSVVELAGDEKKMLGDGEVREILKAYELCCLKKEHLSKLRELFVRYGVVKPHTDKKYFTPEVVTSLLRLFKFMGGYGELEWGVVEHSPAKPVPNLNNPVLGEKGILSKGSNVFRVMGDTPVTDIDARPCSRYVKRYPFYFDYGDTKDRVEQIASYNDTQREQKEKFDRTDGNFFYGSQSYHADKIIVQRKDRHSHEFFGEQIDLGSIWPGRMTVACEDAEGYLAHFAPVFVTRRPDCTYTKDKREYERFREEGAEFLRSKEYLDAFPEDDWKTSFFATKRFDSLLTWLEQNCS